MSPPERQSVPHISKELSIHFATLYARMAWRLQGEVVPASEKFLQGWSAADKLTVLLEIAGLNTTEIGAFFLKGASSRCCNSVSHRLTRITMPSFDLAKQILRLRSASELDAFPLSGLHCLANGCDGHGCGPRRSVRSPAGPPVRPGHAMPWHGSPW